jgi:hypothetical protein
MLNEHEAMISFPLLLRHVVHLHSGYFFQTPIPLIRLNLHFRFNSFLIACA